MTIQVKPAMSAIVCGGVSLILIGIVLLSAGRAQVVSQQDVYEGNGRIFIWNDLDTGCHYIVIEKDNAVAITPRMRAQGTKQVCTGVKR